MEKYHSEGMLQEETVNRRIREQMVNRQRQSLLKEL